ncbi:hypothetical protein [Geopsychrobacter electrodiphilus]|uniref:hypothetical protein n=1 Tax=Geopsychrobacter electrodiphilus TaxID=225196 RepID=UPI00036B90F4|nr:hypothetical protein [Geopsychrobacter electrodiphilus]
MEVRSICCLCQREQNIPAQDNDSHTLCEPHIRSFYGDEMADRVLAATKARLEVELANPFLVEQAF